MTIPKKPTRRWACYQLLLYLTLAILPPRAALPASEGTSTPVSSDPVFKATLTDGTLLNGRIDSFTETALTFATLDGPKQDLGFDRLIKLSRETSISAAESESTHQVLLPDGDLLSRVNVLAASETSLVVQSSILGKVLLPINSPIGTILAPPRQAEALVTLRNQVLREPRTTEVLWLSNGDRLTGSFQALDNHEIKFLIDANVVSIDRSRVLALGFDPSLVNYPKPTNAYLEFTLTDGSRLGLTGVHISEGHVQGKARFGEPIRFPLVELSRVYSRSASIVYLSDRTPAGVQYVPFVGPTRPIRIDQTVDGYPFQLAGESFDRGVGAQSRTLMAYRVQAGDRRFQALVGVDERAGPLGSVVFRILVDGKERFKSPSLTAHDSPRPVDIEIAGAKSLILATEFGDRGEVRDLADWVEARIIR